MSRQRPAAFRTDARLVMALSAGKAAWWAANGLAARRLTRPGSGPAARAFSPEAPPPDPKALRAAWLGAFRKDARDVAEGLYPRSERFPANPLHGLVRALDFLIDARQVDVRRRQGRGQEVRDMDLGDGRPAYYRQNFHFQSGGWFTPESAKRYEAQVEALFSGAAGPMRRRGLALLARALKGRDQRDLKILDLACGSGAFLADLEATFPRSTLLALDLSEAYLAEAGRRSAAGRVLAAAERLPFADAALDAIVSVYLFHELPPKVRPLVAQEIRRVLTPGGVFVFVDSVQRGDAPDMARLLEAFPVFFHEPYYESYQATDVDALFAAAGLIRAGEDAAFLTKAVLFEKARSTE